MIKEIYSQIQKEKLLHIVFRLSEFTNKEFEGFREISPSNEFLQVLFIRHNKGKKFIPHYHIPNKREIDVTNEGWIVIKGKVKATLYDLDETILTEEVLNAGDCSITFSGAHTYEILEDDTLVYECKNGPFYNSEVDRKRL